MELPLSALLSQVLVAFAIEFDNEFEHRMPHWTTDFGGSSRQGPWLVSLALFSNVIRLVPEQGITIKELHRQARTPMLNLRGMARWRYIKVDQDMVRPTRYGLMAQAIGQPLIPEIEQRWQSRFGTKAFANLRGALAELVNQFEVSLPEFLPILGYGLSTRILRISEQSAETADRMHLPALLSKVLLAFTLHFERKSKISLAIGANIMRLLTEEGVRVRDLPRMSGVSKQAIQMALGWLKKRGYAVEASDPTAARTKIVGLTPEGLSAWKTFCERMEECQTGWRKRFGAPVMNGLCTSLSEILSDRQRFFSGFQPYPEGWRAKIKAPETLPHYPMVLHRGGFPDGS